MAILISVCRQMKMQIAGIFGPVSESSRGYLQSLSQTFLIPHINAVWDSRVNQEYFSINVYPDHEVLSGAFADLIKYWEWTTFTVVYEDNNSKLGQNCMLNTLSIQNMIVAFFYIYFLCMEKKSIS